MTGKKQVTPETFIRCLPYSVNRYLCTHLDMDQNWRKMVQYVPKKLGCSENEFEGRYSLLSVKVFEEKSKKQGGSAANCILTDWGTQNAQVKHLLKVLIKSKLYALADYLSDDQMNLGKVPREDSSEDLPNSGADQVLVAGEAAFSRPNVDQELNNTNSINKDNLYRPKMPVKSFPLQNDDCSEMYNRMTSYDSGVPSPDLKEEVPSKDCGIPSMDVSNLPKPPPVKPENKEIFTSTEDLLASKVLPFHELCRFTNNFNINDISDGGNVIGSGGFGRVFLGVLPNGNKIAVKQLDLKGDNLALQEKQFATELKSLSTYHHDNIVLLLGYSVDGPQKCLIYEYMPNGSLEDRLCCHRDTPPLPWKLRMNIIHGTAKGIAYLNNEKVVHRDIKSANVLLDENFVPKVGDFATVRKAPSGNGLTIAETCQVIGTSAYMAPEAIRSFDVSAKLDSFAFGVVLLEVLTGLPPHDPGREEADLVTYIQENCEDDITDLLDMKAGDWDFDIANSVFSISKKCLEVKKKKRALVSEVLPEIELLQ